MRSFQRVAAVAAVVAGLSSFGVGSAFAGEDGSDGQAVTAVATSTANAVATWGPQDKAAAAPQATPEIAPQAAPQAAPVAAAPQAAPEAAAPQTAPEAAPEAAAPAAPTASEYGYGEYTAPQAAQ